MKRKKKYLPIKKKKQLGYNLPQRRQGRFRGPKAHKFEYGFIGKIDMEVYN